MKRLAALVLLAAAPAFAQVDNGWQEIQNGWGEIQTVPGYSGMPAPPGCVSTSVPFFGASVTLTCDGGISYDAATNRLSVGALRIGTSTTAGWVLTADANGYGSWQAGGGGGTAGTGEDSILIGTGATSTALRSVAVGAYSAATGDGGVAAGDRATATGGGVALGVTASAIGGVTLGYISNGRDGVVIGAFANGTAVNGGNVAIGLGANSGTYDSIVLGRSSLATASNQFVAGSHVIAGVGPITDVYFGSGVYNTIGQVEDVTFHGTGGSGTNVTGGDVGVASGAGTGDSPASLVIISGDALGGATGSSPHAVVKRAVFNLSGRSLSGGVASSLFDVPLLSSPSSSGGQIYYTIRATDGTEEIVTEGRVRWVVRRTGAGPTYASTVTPDIEVTSPSSGTLSTAWEFVSGTDKATMRVTPTITGISPTLIELVTEVHCQGRTDIVPIPF